MAFNSHRKPGTLGYPVGRHKGPGAISKLLIGNVPGYFTKKEMK